jgi:hypothetical protein
MARTDPEPQPRLGSGRSLAYTSPRPSAAQAHHADTAGKSREAIQG